MRLPSSRRSLGTSLAGAVLSLCVAGAACSDAEVLDPKTADLQGTLVSVVTGTSRINVRSSTMDIPVDPPPTLFDFTLTVTGKVYVETETGVYREIGLDEIPVPSPVWIWGDGPITQQFPSSTRAARVLVRDIPGGTRKVRR